ncbi:MAG: LPS export ABC transporter periplasmic protein LptC [Gemmatimonadetes bacterium]|nr:LPS export ABC transporter periplasmic protein LptC [Gemmatimonadota bacterium]
MRQRGLAVALAALALGACEETAPPVVANDFMQGIDAPVVFGMVSYITTNGVREGRVEADTAFTFADSTKVDLRVMRVTFYDAEGNERATVRGRTGEWNQDTDRMVARGDVELFVYTDSSTLRSSEIFYDPDIDRIWSDSATVRTLKNGTETRGSAFESDIEFTNVRILNVRGDAGRIF